LIMSGLKAKEKMMSRDLGFDVDRYRKLLAEVSRREGEIGAYRSTDQRASQGTARSSARL
jgi:hypothetical protein